MRRLRFSVLPPPSPLLRPRPVLVPRRRRQGARASKICTTKRSPRKRRARGRRPGRRAHRFTTRHSAIVDGRTLTYTATAGTLTIRDAAGKPNASIFYTADTLDGAAGSRRPITFFYNGGPGSASLWLRMGSFGPMRIQTGNPEYIRPAPFNFGPNPDTLLGTTDLVFIDAPGTGYSRPLGDAKPARLLRRRPGRRRIRQGDHPLRRPSSTAGTAPSSCSAKATGRPVPARSPTSCRTVASR